MQWDSKNFFKNIVYLLFKGAIIYLTILLCEAVVIQSIPPLYNGRSITATPLILLNAYLYKRQNSYYKFLVLLSILIGSVIGIKYLTGVFPNPIAFDLLLGFTISLANLILLSTAIFKHHFITLPLMYVIFFCAFLPTIFIWSYFYISNSYFTVDTILAIFQTNIIEAKEYILAFSNWKSICCLFFILPIATVVLLKIKKELFIKSLTKSILILIILSLITNCWLMYRCRTNIISGPFFEAIKYLDLYNHFNTNKTLRKENIMIDSTPNSGLYVLIIGESHSKNYTSAFGYKSETSPWLDYMKTNDYTLFFNHAHSNHVQTIPSVTYALTAKNQYNTLNLQDSISLLEAVEAVGFDTAWISNQFKFAVHDTPITVIAEEANQQIWLNGNSIKGETQKYDGDIISELKNIKYHKDMLLVIHLMGSHSSYSQRYPNNFKHFKPNTNLNFYKDSLRYTDYVVKNIYQEISKQPNFKALVYFSDHGEIPGVGHDTNKYDEAMTDIPFYIIFNPNYIKENPDIYNNLKASVGKPFTNDLIYNTVLGLLNIKLRGAYEKNNDLTNPLYDDNPTRFSTLHGKAKFTHQHKDVIK